MSDMSQDNTIEYTIEENETEKKVEAMPIQKPLRQANGLTGIPQHIINQLPPSFFESQPIEHGDAVREFMLRHNTNMKNHEQDMVNIHPSEYFKKIVMKEKIE